MTKPIDQLSLYLHLANVARKQLRMPDRDRLLVLSASVATRMDLGRIASYCRLLVLQNNPGHMLKRWATVADAIGSEDFLYFLKQLQRRYPLEKAETMLSLQGVDRSNERAAYYCDEEYAAALMGVNQEWLEQQFGVA